MDRLVIRLRKLHFSYRPGAEVLRGLSLDLPPGLCLLLGPNGCGKSTLLRMAAGVEKPASGTVTIHGNDLWMEEVAARSHLAYLPEHPDLSPYATVHEILVMVCGLRRQPESCAEDVLQWVGLDGLQDRTVRELSMGQRRRAVLAAARIGLPNCLLLDEPLEAIDRGMRSEIVEWLVLRRLEGATIIVASHVIEPFISLADRAFTVRDGLASSVDPLPDDLTDRAAVLEKLAR